MMYVGMLFYDGSGLLNMVKLINEPRLPWTKSSETLPQDSSPPSLTAIR